MKRLMQALLAAGIFSSLISGSLSANPGMSTPPHAATAPAVKTPPAHHHHTPPRVYPRPPIRVVPPFRALPPVVVTPPAPPLVIPATPTSFTGSGVLTNGAWVAQNPQTGMFSIAFDSPGVSGMGILLNAGYTVLVRGPTNWTDATAYLKSIGAPGW